MKKNGINLVECRKLVHVAKLNGQNASGVRISGDIGGKRCMNVLEVRKSGDIA